MDFCLQTTFSSMSYSQINSPSWSSSASDLAKDLISMINEFHEESGHNHMALSFDQGSSSSRGASTTSSLTSSNSSSLSKSKIHQEDLDDKKDTESRVSSGTRASTKRICKHPSSIQSHASARQKTLRALWKPEEDAIVLYYIASLGPRWAHIASFLRNRTGKQVRDRYLNHLQPNIRSDEWTPQEDEQLIELYHKHGKKWCKIAAGLEGRTEALVKNRFYTHIRQLLKRRSKEARKDEENENENESDTTAASLVDSPYNVQEEHGMSLDLLHNTDVSLFHQQQTPISQQIFYPYSTHPVWYYSLQTYRGPYRKEETSFNVMEDPDRFISCSSRLINTQEYNIKDDYLSELEEMLLQELRSE